MALKYVNLGASLVAQMVKRLPTMRATRVQSARSPGGGNKIHKPEETITHKALEDNKKGSLAYIFTLHIRTQVTQGSKEWCKLDLKLIKKAVYVSDTF